MLLALPSLALAPGQQAGPGTLTPDAPETATALPSETPAPTETETASPSPIGSDGGLPSPTATLAASEPAEATQTSASLAVPRLHGEYVQDEVLITFRRRADKAAISRCMQGVRAAAKSEIRELGVYVLRVPEGQVAETLAGLRGCPETRHAEPNYIAHIADTIPSDPGWSLQYGLVRIRAPQGWDLNTGSSAVMIAVVDTGVDLGHPDLAPKIVGGYDFVHGDASAQDDNGHGTHVAGIAAAATNNNTGIAGVSWGALIMPVKVLNAAGTGSFANVAEGIVWAADHGAQVINLSLGGSSDSQVLKAAVDYAYNKGVVLVAAAGNTGSASVLYPARYPNVIAVAATDGSDQRAGFSNYGAEVDVAAPGDSIYSTWPGGGYRPENGTSMAAPYVSGLAAILRGMPGIGSPEVIAWDIENSALDIEPAGVDAYTGHGLIQMDKAIRLAVPPTPTAQPASNPAASGGFGSLPIASTWTVTLSPGVAPTSSLTFTPSATAPATMTPAPTETAAASVVEDQRPRPDLQAALLSKLGSDWPLGCGGSLLVILGAWWLWSASRRRRYGSIFA